MNGGLSELFDASAQEERVKYESNYHFNNYFIYEHGIGKRLPAGANVDTSVEMLKSGLRSQAKGIKSLLYHFRYRRQQVQSVEDFLYAMVLRKRRHITGLLNCWKAADDKYRSSLREACMDVKREKQAIQQAIRANATYIPDDEKEIAVKAYYRKQWQLHCKASSDNIKTFTSLNKEFRANIARLAQLVRAALASPGSEEEKEAKNTMAVVRARQAVIKGKLQEAQELFESRPFNILCTKAKDLQAHGLLLRSQRSAQPGSSSSDLAATGSPRSCGLTASAHESSPKQKGSSRQLKKRAPQTKSTVNRKAPAPVKAINLCSLVEADPSCAVDSSRGQPLSKDHGEGRLTARTTREKSLENWASQTQNFKSPRPMNTSRRAQTGVSPEKQGSSPAKQRSSPARPRPSPAKQRRKSFRPSVLEISSTQANRDTREIENSSFGSCQSSISDRSPSLHKGSPRLSDMCGRLRPSPSAPALLSMPSEKIATEGSATPGQGLLESRDPEPVDASSPRKTKMKIFKEKNRYKMFTGQSSGHEPAPDSPTSKRSIGSPESYASPGSYGSPISNSSISPRNRDPCLLIHRGESPLALKACRAPLCSSTTPRTAPSVMACTKPSNMPSPTAVGIESMRACIRDEMPTTPMSKEGTKPTNHSSLSSSSTESDVRAASESTSLIGSCSHSPNGGDRTETGNASLPQANSNSCDMSDTHAVIEKHSRCMLDDVKSFRLSDNRITNNGLRRTASWKAKSSPMSPTMRTGRHVKLCIPRKSLYSDTPDGSPPSGSRSVDRLTQAMAAAAEIQTNHACTQAEHTQNEHTQAGRTEAGHAEADAIDLSLIQNFRCTPQALLDSATGQLGMVPMVTKKKRREITTMPVATAKCSEVVMDTPKSKSSIFMASG